MLKYTHGRLTYLGELGQGHKLHPCSFPFKTPGEESSCRAVSPVHWIQHNLTGVERYSPKSLLGINKRSKGEGYYFGTRFLMIGNCSLSTGYNLLIIGVRSFRCNRLDHGTGSHLQYVSGKAQYPIPCHGKYPAL